MVVDRAYRPALEFGLRWRYVTAAFGMATLIVTLGMVLGGWATFIVFPNVEPDVIAASITMPQGTPVTVTSDAVRKLEEGAERLRQEVVASTGSDIFRHTYAAVEATSQRRRVGRDRWRSSKAAASHLGEVTIELAPADQRTLTSEELGNRWRELTDPIPEAISVTFQFSMMSIGEDVDVMLVGPNLEQLTLAAEQVKARLGEYAGVFDITDSFQAGKPELRLGIKPGAETLGLSLEDLGRQVRQAFYGEEAQRIQRGRDDIRVMVRYPADQRRSLGNLEGMWIRTPDGGGVPFDQVAEVQPGRGFASIKRVDRNRAVNVTASVDAGVASSGAVLADLENRILPEVLARYPGAMSSRGCKLSNKSPSGAYRWGSSWPCSASSRYWRSL